MRGISIFAVKLLYGVDYIIINITIIMSFIKVTVIRITFLLAIIVRGVTVLAIILLSMG